MKTPLFIFLNGTLVSLLICFTACGGKVTSYVPAEAELESISPLRASELYFCPDEINKVYPDLNSCVWGISLLSNQQNDGLFLKNTTAFRSLAIVPSYSRFESVYLENSDGSIYTPLYSLNQGAWFIPKSQLNSEDAIKIRGMTKNKQTVLTFIKTIQ